MRSEQAVLSGRPTFVDRRGHFSGRSGLLKIAVRTRGEAGDHPWTRPGLCRRQPGPIELHWSFRMHGHPSRVDVVPFLPHRRSMRPLRGQGTVDCQRHARFKPLLRRRRIQSIVNGVR